MAQCRPTANTVRARVPFIAASVMVFAVTAAMRWSTLSAMRGDDHWPLWTAATVIKGDRPFRDFADLGDPLYWGLSTLAQWMAGYRVAGEVMLGTLLTAMAFTIAFVLAVRATRSIPVSAALVLCASLITAEAELYSYSKLFPYPIVLWMSWRYVDKPGAARAAALAGSVAFAFGYRHDHGAYAGAGAAAAVLAAHLADGWRGVMHGCARFGVLLAVLLLPLFVAIQLDEGLITYFRERMQVAALLDSSSRRPVPFVVDAAAPSGWFRVTEAPPARVFVAWQANLTPEERRAREQRYSLTPVQDRGGGSFEYALADAGSDNIRDIVEDPAVSDTGLIDREGFSVAEESWIVDLYRAVPLLRMSLAPQYWHPQNAAATLHYVARALPYVLLALLAMAWLSGYRPGPGTPFAAQMFAAAVLAAVVFGALVRRIGYFMDHTAVTVVLLAVLIGFALRARREAAPRAVRVMASISAVVFATVWVCASITYAQTHTTLKAMNDNWNGLWWKRSVEQFNAYSVSPPIDQYAPPGADQGQLIRYVYECTAPTDRVWVMTDLFHFPYYTERRIVRHIYWNLGFLASDEQQRRAIAIAERDPVPIIISNSPVDPMEHFERYPLVRDYVARRYTGRYMVAASQPGQANFYLLADSRRTPTRFDPLFGFPCYR